MTENSITYNDKGDAMAFNGPEAVAVFNAAALRSGLGLMQAGIKPHRSWTSLRVVFQNVTRYTGQRYNGRKDIDRARADLHEFVQINKARLSR